MKAEGKKIDCHAHCYDLAVQPFSPTSGFDVHANELGSIEDFAAVLDAHDVSNAVLVNPLGGYGCDNTYLLRAIEKGQGRFKGVALLSSEASAKEVGSLVDGGVVGVRFNLNFPTSPSLFGSEGERTLAIAREVGWHVQVHYSGASLVPAIPILRGAKIVIIDHCGRPDMTRGIDQPGFRELLALGREGRAYIKLSAFFRMADSAGSLSACDQYVEALLDAFAPDRRLWGSDWPFTRSQRRVDYGPQLAYLKKMLPDPKEREQVLWSNPARLFGFVGGEQA